MSNCKYIKEETENFRTASKWAVSLNGKVLDIFRTKEAQQYINNGVRNEFIVKVKSVNIEKGYHLTEELENLGWVLVKENSHPRGWSLARKIDITNIEGIGQVIIKRLDNYILKTYQ